MPTHGGNGENSFGAGGGGRGNSSTSVMVYCDQQAPLEPQRMPTDGSEFSPVSAAVYLIGDIMVDRSGKLWRVTDVKTEPTVTLEEIEPAIVESVVNAYGAPSTRPKITNTSTVSHFVENGWLRIYSPRCT